MDTVVSSGAAGQPILVSGDKGCHEGRHDERFLISDGHMQEAVREHGLHGDASRERFGLSHFRELSDIRREMSEFKCQVELRIADEANKTRDMFREHEIARMRGEEATLRAQLIAAGVVPAA